MLRRIDERAHAHALLPSDGTTAVIEADMRDPGPILDHPDLHRLIDFDEPVAVLFMSVLHFIADEEDPYGLVGAFRDRSVPGSYLALSTVTADSNPREVTEGLAVYAARGIPERARDRAEVARLCTAAGLELIDPGVQLVHRWRPDEESAALADAHVQMHGAVARKP